MTRIMKEVLFYAGILTAMAAGLMARVVVADEIGLLSAVAS